MHAAKSTAAAGLQVEQFPSFSSAGETAIWPDRRRGISNFLTWPFFLAELWAADLFFGSGARAEETLTDPEKRSQDFPQTDEDAPRLQPWQQADPSLEPDAPAQLGSLAGAPVLTQGIGPTAPVSFSGAMDQPIFGPASGGGGGGSAGINSQQMSETITASKLIENLDASKVLDLGLDLTPVEFELLPDVEIQPVGDVSLDLHTLGFELGVESELLRLEAEFHGETLSNIVDDITGLNLIGTIEGLTDLLDPSVDASPSFAAEPASATSLVNSAAEAAGPILSVGPDDLSSSGAIALPISDEPEPDSLFVDGKYTEFNLALQQDADTNQGDVSASASGDTDDVAVIDVSVEEGAGSSIDLSIGDSDLLRGL